MKTVIAFLIAGIALVSASCPNMCSGHGSCAADDVCQCWNGYIGADCSLRSCLETESWAIDSSNPHLYSECANRGICDRATGQCKCFEGYTGQACERATCPNDCSGNGKCRMVQDLQKYSPAGTLDWDEKSIVSCVCDGGFFGPDCSLRKCPFGDDPVTVCDQNKRTEQVQRVSVTVGLDFGQNQANDGVSDVAVVRNAELALSFTTPSGTNYTTRRVENSWGSSTDTFLAAADVTGAAAGTVTASLETAIESLPNFAVRDVTVSKNTGTAAASADVTNSFDVTFHHEQDGQNSYGPQSLMWCHQPNACPTAGCQPKFTQLYAVGALQNDGAGGATAVVTSAGWKAAVAYDGADFAGKQFVRFTSDSVLACPTGKTCTAAARNLFNGGITVIVKGDATDGAKVFVKTFGGGVGADADFLTVKTVGANAFPDYKFTGAGGAVITNAVLTGYSYAGELTSANAAKFDITDFIPGTYLEFQAGLAGNANVNAGAHFFYKLGACTVTDVTESGTAHDNDDAENIECSGRGECDRSSGTCSCFAGYTGVNCGAQSVLL